MPRKKLITSDVFPYHVTARTNNREIFPIPLNEVWKILEFECFSATVVHGLEFQSLVLMPNHFHAIITTPEKNLGKSMNSIMLNTSKTIGSMAKKTGHLYGGPYHWSIIQDGRYFGQAFKYVYRNPVRAGLCKSVEDYPYSTLHGRLGLSPLGIPLHFTRLGMEANGPDPDNFPLWLSWLNTPFYGETEKAIGDALKRKEFKLIKRSSRTRIPEET